MHYCVPVLSQELCNRGLPAYYLDQLQLHYCDIIIGLITYYYDITMASSVSGGCSMYLSREYGAPLIKATQREF